MLGLNRGTKEEGQMGRWDDKEGKMGRTSLNEVGQQWFSREKRVHPVNVCWF